MKNEAKNIERNIEEIVKEYDELVQRSNGIDPSWKDEEVNALMDRISKLEKEYDQTVITFEMEIFQDYTCTECAVVNDLEVEVPFSLEELSKMRYLVSQLDDYPFNNHVCKNEELETDCPNGEEELKTEINEHQSYPDASPDDLPF